MSTRATGQLALAIRMLAYLKYVRATAAITGLVIVGRIGFEILCFYFLSPTITSLAIELGRASVATDKGFWTWLSGSSDAVQTLRPLLIWMTVAQLGLGVFTYLRNVWDTKLSMRTVYFLRDHLYDRLQRVGFGFYDRMTSGQLINRALSDLQGVRAFINVSVINILDIVVSVVGYLGLLAIKSPWLTLAAVVPTPLSLWLIIRFSRRAQPLYDAQRSSTDQLMNKLTESVYGSQVIKSFGTEEIECRAYRAANLRLFDRMMPVIKLQARLTPSLKLVAIFSHIALFLLTAYLIQQDHMQIGDLMILGAAMGTVLVKLEQVNFVADIYQRGIVSARRLFEVLDTPPEAQPADQAIIPDGTPAIVFQRVSFGYDPGKVVLQDVSLRLEGGQMTALVGPTGAGKTTLATLLARFYEPQQGAVLIGDVDLRSLSLKELRRTVGYVFQETFLFTDTVRNNIRYGRTDVSEKMLREAVRVADAEEFISGLPQGLDTRLGEGGVLLSGGQRQRLALARALVYDPKVLILDDATAALDAATEASVHGRLRPLFAGRTVLVIAHRVSTLHRADTIIVLDRGMVVQSGSHEALMIQSGPYRDLVRLQLTQDLMPLAPFSEPLPQPPPTSPMDLVEPAGVAV